MMDAIDEVRRRLGELASMENELCAARGSRDHWRKRAEESESELNALAVEMAHSWVKLPVDAEGVPIHVGDVLDGYGKTIEVVDMRYGRSGWVLIGRDGNGYADTLAFAHHHEQRTVEDVLSDFADDVIMCCDDREKLAAAAAEIRELLGVGTCKPVDGYDDDGEDIGEVCSACGETWPYFNVNYCPNCGAKVVA